MTKGIYKRKPISEETRRKLSIAKMGNKNSMFGKLSWCRGKIIGKLSGKRKIGWKLSEETKKKMSIAKRGIIPLILRSGKENHPRYIRDRTQIKRQTERNNPNDKQWKYAVYKRDNFKCRISNENCVGKIEAHHILVWKDYPELRYELNNGITLCHAHHPKKRAEEKQLVPYFMGLVETKV